MSNTFFFFFFFFFFRQHLLQSSPISEPVAEFQRAGRLVTAAARPVAGPWRSTRCRSPPDGPDRRPRAD